MYLLLILLTKTANRFVRFLGLGSGLTWPGHLALKLRPHLLRELASRLPAQTVLISGTNGKTTTAKLIRHLAESQGMSVLHNSSGANLFNGIVSCVLLGANWRGELPYDLAIFEVDEFTLPKLMKELTPSVLALLNLSRDQLDRHWETDLVLSKWLEAVRGLSTTSHLILPDFQAELAGLAEAFSGKVSFFGETEDNLNGTSLRGAFNARNVNCALLAAETLGIPQALSQPSLVGFEYAYGRGERFTRQGRSWQILLAKNPESLNQNLQLLQGGGVSYDTLLYVLNDNIPDGLDVSWIYDVSPRLLRKASEGKRVYVSGRRALDMAVRLQYAGVSISPKAVQADLPQVIKAMASESAVGEVAVLPNYSSMLEIRRALLGRRIL